MAGKPCLEFIRMLSRDFFPSSSSFLPFKTVPNDDVDDAFYFIDTVIIRSVNTNGLFHLDHHLQLYCD